jgi:GAF domain-containing protein
MGDMTFPGGLRPDGLPAALSDPERLAAVRATGLLDTGPEEPFDDLARLAAAVTGCRRAFITLVDEHRSFWKSCIGADAGPAGRQAPVRESFCYFLGGAPFVVEDAAADPRTSSHPSVRPVKIGAWAGYPLLTPAGQVLGSLCVIDENPHPWQPQELAALAAMARAASSEINLQTSLTAAQDALAAAETALAASTALARTPSPG